MLSVVVISSFIYIIFSGVGWVRVSSSVDKSRERGKWKTIFPYFLFILFPSCFQRNLHPSTPTNHQRRHVMNFKWVSLWTSSRSFFPCEPISNSENRLKRLANSKLFNSFLFDDFLRIRSCWKSFPDGEGKTFSISWVFKVRLFNLISSFNLSPFNFSSHRWLASVLVF